ncbi:MAG: tetratricopeptide repeat protein, partial [Bacteroidales bacterium]
VKDPNKAKDKKEDEVDANDHTARKKSDKNINKFKQLMMADDAGLDSKYDNKFRGKIQERNVQLKQAGDFVLSYYEKGDKLKSTVRYDKALEIFNKQSGLRKKLLLVNEEPPLNEMQMQEHFNSIDEYSREIQQQPDNATAYFARALDFMLVQDFASSLEDLTRSLMLDNRSALAYFQRAVVRSKQLEFERSQEIVEEELPMNKSLNSFNQKSDKAKNQKAPKMDNELVIRDYDMAIDLNPGFTYAYFNRANARTMQKDFRNAILDFNEAIRIDPEFAEAYFNRGLVYIYQNQTEKGIADLSKAGELGMSEAYNLIKRLSDEK